MPAFDAFVQNVGEVAYGEALGELAERRRLAHRALARHTHCVTASADDARQGPPARGGSLLRRGRPGEQSERDARNEQDTLAGHQWHIRLQRGERSNRSRVTPPNIHSRNREWP